MTNLLDQDAGKEMRSKDLIRTFPCFSSLSSAQSEELTSHLQKIHIMPHEQIVNEDDIIDSIYIIEQGKAEVTITASKRKKRIQVPVAVLRAGEAIGLSDTGFYSSTGKRTATVTALTNMTVLKLNLKDLHDFLYKYNLETSMYAASSDMLNLLFIKKSLPFAKLSYERLQWLSNHIEETTVPAGAFIFKQGEVGDKCYLIRKGQVEIITQDEANKERRLAVLKPPTLFGEATLITHAPRNATARALEDCELLVLQHAYLAELIASEDQVANMFMSLMVDRSRPLQNPHVSVHSRIMADGQTVTILKNPDKGNYFKLAREGAFIWQQLDGKHTMQDITLSLAEKFNIFAPDVVATLITKLTLYGFITNLEISTEAPQSPQPLWVRGFLAIRRVLEWRVAFGDADRLLTKTYHRIHFLFTKPGQLILAIIACIGLFTFIINTPIVLLFFSYKPVSLLLLLGLIPLSSIEVFLHELGHAFAVKAFGREVHYIGVGWYWFSPIAFTDTSDMWLSTRRPRMWVNFAGIYVDLLVAGLSSLFIPLIENPYLQGMLWLFALYTYIGSIRMMSPLQEMDGYYILMDWLEKPRLRQSAVLWLVRKLQKTFHQPSLLQENTAEISYWIACTLYLAVITALTFLLQHFVFKILGITTNPYLSFILPFLVVVFSCFSIIADIRHQKEE